MYIQFYEANIKKKTKSEISFKLGYKNNLSAKNRQLIIRFVSFGKEFVQEEHQQTKPKMYVDVLVHNLLKPLALGSSAISRAPKNKKRKVPKYTYNIFCSFKSPQSLINPCKIQ